MTSTAAEKGESKIGESEVSSADVLRCVALFQYVSDEPGDLSFEAGETIEVLKKVKKYFFWHQNDYQNTQFYIFTH